MTMNLVRIYNVKSDLYKFKIVSFCPRVTA